MGETKRVIHKRTVVHTNSAGNKGSSSLATETEQNSSIQALVKLAVVVAIASFFVKNSLDSWRYEIRQQEFRNLFNVTIVQDFLAEKDPSLLEKVLNDELWRACHILTLEPDIRFWYYPQNEPNNIFEELIQRTYQDTPYWQKAISYEYWCNIMERANQEWPWHTDRDEDVLTKENKLVFPLMGAIYYGSNHSYQGANFQMVDSIPYETEGKPKQPDDNCGPDFCVSNPTLLNNKDEALYVETTFDMLLYANVTHFHKVTPLKSGMRYALAMNANHWLPYRVEQAPTNKGILEMAEQLVASKAGDTS